MRFAGRRRARLLHAVGGAAVGGVMVAVLWPLLPSAPSSQAASITLGYVSLAALLLTLSIGPLNLLLRRPNPRSQDLRRDAGLWAAATAGAHIGFSLQHHFGGRVASYFFRHDRFGIAIWLGTAATVVVVLLALTSSDRAIRVLGVRWKTLQRTNYVLAVLAVGHTAVFWNVLRRNWLLWLAVAATVTAVAFLQLAGFLTYRRQAQRREAGLGGPLSGRGAGRRPPS